MRRRITVVVCVCVSGSIFPNSNESAKKTYNLPLAGARAYIHSHDVALDHMVFLLRAFPLCLAWRYIAHVRIFMDVDLNYVQSFAWSKVWSYI